MIPDIFNLVNVTDTCAVWHLVGADTLFRSARRANTAFIITPTVFYECFVKTRGNPVTPERLELQDRLRAHLAEDRVSRMEISIDDLQATVALARHRKLDKRLGQGELSCAALARHLNQAVLTDNRRDFRAIEKLVEDRLQTTPRLLGWLYVEEYLTDREVDDIIHEHTESHGHMSQVYRDAYLMACEKRLMLHMASTT